MNITCISDLHGHLPTIPDTDILVIAGDIAPDFYGEHPARNGEMAFDVSAQVLWVAGNFLPWLEDLQARNIVVIGIAGNHDWWLQDLPQAADSLPWIYLCDSGVELGGVKFYGTPHQPFFCDWAFNAPDLPDRGEEFLREKFSMIPDDTDVLISHGPPTGILDAVGRRRVGSSSLSRRVQEVQPRLTVFGHVHRPGVEVIEGCVFANVTQVNEAYEMVYSPVTFTV